MTKKTQVRDLSLCTPPACDVLSFMYVQNSRIRNRVAPLEEARRVLPNREEYRLGLICLVYPW
jgi:hypothetical protein